MKYFLLVVIIMAMEGLALFLDGAYFINAMTLYVVFAWTLLIVLLRINGQERLIAADKLLLAATIAFLLFWIWNGLSIFWSISADESWIEFNRTGGYFALFLLGLLLSVSFPVRNFAALLFAGAAMTAVIYGLGTKIFPGTVENLAGAARINVPLGYVNGVGVLIAMCVPLMLYAACSGKHHWVLRTFAAAALPVLLVTLFFTLSRGSILALILGMALFLILVPLRLRAFSLLALALLPASLAIWWSSDQDALMLDKAETALKLEAASDLRLYLLFSIAAVSIVFFISLYVGASKSFSPATIRSAGIAIVTLVSIVAVVGAFTFINSKPSFTGWLEDTYDDIRSKKASEAGAGRLLAMGYSDRLNLWAEAFKNWGDHPFKGTGAQSFPVTHLLLREESQLFVKQPHGLPFRLLSELGLTGAILALVFFALTVALAARNALTVRDRWEKSLAGTLLVVLCIYLIHSLYDWDWNMLALSMPYFFFAGICAGWYVRRKPGNEVTADEDNPLDGRRSQPIKVPE